MLTAAAGCVTPKTRKGRTATVRPLTNMLINSKAKDSTEALRLQRLRLVGIVGMRAELLAQLAWGDAA